MPLWYNTLVYMLGDISLFLTLRRETRPLENKRCGCFQQRNANEFRIGSLLMKRSFVIDVGSSKVSFLDASAEGGALIINRFETCKYDGYSIGSLPHAASLCEAVEELIGSSLTKFDLHLHGISIGVPAPFILSAVTSRSVDTPSGKVRHSDLELLLDRGENIEPPEDYRLMHTTPFDYAVNGIACGGSPIGLRSGKLSAKFCHAFVSDGFVSLIADALEGAGARMGSFISSPMACASFTIPFNARLGGAVLIDCGGTHCDVSAIRGNAVIRTESFGIGGEHFAKDIAYGFELPMPVAEELRRSYSFGLAPSSEPVRIKSDSSLLIDGADLSLIIASRAEEFADRLCEALDAVESELPGGSPVYVVGGGVSDMRGCLDYLSAKTGRSLIPGAPKAGRLNGIQHTPTLSLAHFMLYDGGMPYDAPEAPGTRTGRFIGGIKEFFTMGPIARKHKS